MKVGDLVKHKEDDIIGMIVRAVAKPYIAAVGGTIIVYSVLWNNSQITEEEGRFNLEVVSESS